jgi:hypothetical protein
MAGDISICNYVPSILPLKKQNQFSISIHFMQIDQELFLFFIFFVKILFGCHIIINAFPSLNTFIGQCCLIKSFHRYNP